MVGDPAHPFSRMVSEQYGFSLCEHIARQVTQDMVRNADLILVMDDQQRRMLENQFQGASGKTYCVGHFGKFEIPDPYGKNEEAFQETYQLIEKGIDDWIANLR